MSFKPNSLLNALFMSFLEARVSQSGDIFKEMLKRMPSGPCTDPNCMDCRIKAYVKKKVENPSTTMADLKKLRKIGKYHDSIGNVIEGLGWTDELWDWLIAAYTEMGFAHMPEMIRMFKSFSERLAMFCQQLEDRGAQITDLSKPEPPAPNMDGAQPPAAAGPRPGADQVRERDNAIHEEQAHKTPEATA